MESPGTYNCVPGLIHIYISEEILLSISRGFPLSASAL